MSSPALTHHAHILTEPQVPNRHNYILWLKGLMDSTSYEKPGERTVVGIDIGTGASCIYPLLGTAQRDWSFIATGNTLAFYSFFTLLTL